MADDFPLRVQDVHGHFVFRRGLQIIIDHRARGWVVADRLSLVELFRIMQAQRGLGLIQNEIAVPGLGVHLPQRCDVIKHPKRSAVRCDDEIVIFHHKVVNRRLRQI